MFRGLKVSMDTFETSQKKLNKLYNSKEDNSTLIDKKVNNTNPKQLDQNFISQYPILEDTGDIPLTPVNTVTDITQNKELPVTYTYYYNNYFNIKSEWFPFIDWSYSFRTTEDYNMLPTTNLLLDSWDSNYFKVDGDSETIWHGVTPPIAYPNVGSTRSYADFVTTQSRVVDGSLLTSHTKDAWKTTIEWSNGGSDYRIVNGLLCGFYSNQYTTSSAPCGGNTNNYILFGSLWHDNSVNMPEGTIISVDGMNITVKGYEVHNWWTGTDSPPACVFHTTTTADITKTFNINSDISYLVVYGKRQRKVGSVWSYFPSGGGTGYNDYYIIYGTEITSFLATQDSIFAYWDSAKRFLFSATYNYSFSPATITYSSTPIKTTWNNLPYTQITAQINPDDYPAPKSERLGYTETFITPTVYINNSYDPFYLRVSKSTDSNERWMATFGFGMLQMRPSVSSYDETYLNWSDIYTKNIGETAYNATISHLTKVKKIWFPNTDYIYARIVARARSLFYWKKTSKIGKQTS